METQQPGTGHERRFPGTSDKEHRKGLAMSTQSHELRIARSRAAEQNLPIDRSTAAASRTRRARWCRRIWPTRAGRAPSRNPQARAGADPRHHAGYRTFRRRAPAPCRRACRRAASGTANPAARPSARQSHSTTGNVSKPAVPAGLRICVNGASIAGTSAPSDVRHIGALICTPDSRGVSARSKSWARLS